MCEVPLTSLLAVSENQIYPRFLSFQRNIDHIAFLKLNIPTILMEKMCRLLSSFYLTKTQHTDYFPTV